ncbi:hypothetical protein [Microcoleus sp. MON2_D5]|uniref:hypothetical protein n=1 Tax=Microcoleus sp. MON2_D5 TaxID=2818833 RepID=UPI002FD6A36A
MQLGTQQLNAATLQLRQLEVQDYAIYSCTKTDEFTIAVSQQAVVEVQGLSATFFLNMTFMRSINELYELTFSVACLIMLTVFN